MGQHGFAASSAFPQVPLQRRRVVAAGFATEHRLGAMTDVKRAAEEELAEQRGSKRQKRAKEARFFELEAEEAGGSGDEGDEPDLEDLIDDSAVQPGDKGRAALQKQMQAQERELAELETDMLARHAQRADGSGSFLDDLERKYAAMDQEPEPGAAIPPSPARSVKPTSATYIVPDVKDPKLWCCRTYAPEQDLCIALHLKAQECFAEGKPVQIYSAFYSPHLRGYIYIEAEKENDIRLFIRGIRGISPWQIALVPVAQMPQVFTASQIDASKKVILKVGDWVRIKRGLYSKDLAQIEEVRDDVYTVKIKPRLALGDEKAAKANSKDEKKARSRPVARWFNKFDIENSGGVLIGTMQKLTRHGHISFYVIEDELYRDGFLHKTFKKGWFTVGDNVRPTEHELQDWRGAPPPTENTRPPADLDQVPDDQLMPPPVVVPRKTAAPPPLFQEGEIVIVNKGDLMNLRGVITQAIAGQPSVLIKPFGVDGMEGEISIAIAVLSRYFEIGDYVQVIGGEHEGDTGNILKIQLAEKGAAWGWGTTAVVLSNTMVGEFRARVAHLRKSVVRPAPQDEVDEWHVGQLVRLEGRWTGVIVRMEANARAIVLVTDGRKIVVSFGELEPIALPPPNVYRRKTWAIDRRGDKIYPGCIVKAPGSLYKSNPISAEVLYIHADYVFMKATETLTGERAFICCQSRKTEFVWNRFESPAEKEKQQEASHQGMIQYGVKMASETNWLKPYLATIHGMPEKTQDGLFKGTPVRIVGGGYKGLRGEVRDLLDNKVLVSLLCKPKLVTVKTEFIRPDENFRTQAQKWAPPAPKTPAQQTVVNRSLKAKALGGHAPVTPESQSPSGPGMAAPATPTGLADAANDEAWDPTLFMPESHVVPEAMPVHDASQADPNKESPMASSRRRKRRLPPANAGAESPTLSSREHTFFTAESQTPSPSNKAEPEAAQVAEAPDLETVLREAGVVFVPQGPDSTPQPLQPTKRGETVYVHAGKYKGARGKVMGVTSNAVLIQKTDAERCNAYMSVLPKDVAVCNEVCKDVCQEGSVAGWEDDDAEDEEKKPEDPMMFLVDNM